MGYLSRRRGVISVFLLIVFMVTYIFTGVLVDAARYRMSQTYVESALDNASSSVLSNYNKLVFDLYGLFSVDTEATTKEEMTDEIIKLYNGYLQETLGIVGLDTSKYMTMLNDIFKDEESGYSTSTLYDFNMTNLTAGTSITLANTSNVENQIIEYMKFRAPVELMGDAEGFLKIIEAITSMAENNKAAKAKLELSKEYESDENGNVPISKQANKLLSDLDDFADSVMALGSNQAGTAPYHLCASNGDNYDLNDVWCYIGYFDENFIYKWCNWREDTVNTKRDCVIAMLDIFKELSEKEDYLLVIEEDEIWLSELYNKFYNNVPEKIKTLYSVASYNAELEKIQKIEEIDRYIDNLIKMENGIEAQLSSSVNACEEYSDRYNTLDALHTRLKNEGTYYQNELYKIDETYKNAKDICKNNTINELERREKKASELYNTAVSLDSRIEKLFARYKEYIGKLEKEKENYDSDEAKANFDSEIQSLKAVMGSVLEKKILLLNVKPYLNDIGNGIKSSVRTAKLSTRIESCMSGAILYADGYALESDEVVEELICPHYMVDKHGSYVKDEVKLKELCKEPYEKPYFEWDTVNVMVPCIQDAFCKLYAHAKHYADAGYAQVNGDDTSATPSATPAVTIDSSSAQTNKENDVNSSSEGENETDMDENRPELVNIAYTADMLTVNYDAGVSAGATPTPAVTTEMSIDSSTEIDSEVALNALNIADKLFVALGEMLEEARDKIYVDAYIMTMLPNYYTHYQNYKTDEAQELLSTHSTYLASMTEVEYIITGKALGTDCVTDMETRLFGIRLLLNMVSMFTDASKNTQATILSSWAGAFAPLLAIVIKIAWAVAETVIDVLVLTGKMVIDQAKDGKVSIYKKGDDWFVSVDSLIKELASMAIDAVTKAAIDAAAQLTDAAESKINVLIYDTFDALEGKSEAMLDTVVADFEKQGLETIKGWQSELSSNVEDIKVEDATAKNELNSKINALGSELEGKLSGTLEQGKDEVQGVINSVTDNVQDKAIMIVGNMKEKIMSTVDTTVGKIGDKAKDFVSENISSVLPTGKVGESANSPKMGYTDFLYFFLFTMDQETKLQRVISLVQANLRVGGQTGFKMETAPVAVWADLEYTMKYMFLSDGILPEAFKKDGRLRAKVISAQSY